MVGSLLERAEGAAVTGIVRLPAAAARLLAGRPVRVEGQQLDVHVQLGLRFENLSGGSKLRSVAATRARRRRDARTFAGPRIEVGRVRDLELPGPAGTIAARLYEPGALASPAPLIVYYHGGGHVIGDLDTHDQPCRFLARETPAPLLSVDYRLAPEHPFPAAVEDALAALRVGARRTPAELGADPARIAVAGDSAGGNLAAVVAQLAARRRRPAAGVPALIYPVDRLLVEAPLLRDLFAEGFFLTSAEMDWFRDHYLAARSRPRRPARIADPRRRPLRASAGLRRHRRLRPAARRGRGLRRAPARGRRPGDAAARARSRSRVHQRGRTRRALAAGLRDDRSCDPRGVDRRSRPRLGAQVASEPTTPLLTMEVLWPLSSLGAAARTLAMRSRQVSP